MKKVVDIGAAKPCQWCGRSPSCPDWTCERLASVEWDENGALKCVEFVIKDAAPPVYQVHFRDPDPAA